MKQMDLEECIAVKKLTDCLLWYLYNDDTNMNDEYNGYYIDGYLSAKKTIMEVRGWDEDTLEAELKKMSPIYDD